MPVQQRHGVQYLIETFRQAEPGSITLVTLGPLTNVAMALVEAPDIGPRIGRSSRCSGTWSENGNITPAAAFNEYVDPEAADVVLTSGIKLTMVPMDLTHQCLTTPRASRRIARERFRMLARGGGHARLFRGLRHRQIRMGGRAAA